MVEYDVHQALNILKKYYITDSVQMVTRWIRQGKIRGERSDNRKEGYRIHHDDLFEFIEEERPGLPSIMAVYEEYQERDVPQEIKMKIKKEDKPNKCDEPLITFDTEETNHGAKNETLLLEEQLQEKSEEIAKLNESLFESIKEVEILEEDNKFLYDLCHIYEEENRELKQKFEVLQFDTKEKEKSDLKQHPKPYKEVKEILGGIMKELSIEPDIEEQIVPETLNRYFDDKKEWRPGIYKGKQSYYCPIKKEEYKYLKTMLKNGATIIHQSLKDTRDLIS